MEPAAQPVGPDSSKGLALVTGAGRRLGRVIALEMGRLGYAVGLHYFRSKLGAEEAAQELRGRGVRTELYCADLRSPQQIEALFAEVDTSANPMQVLVNSAGVMPRQNLREVTAEEWDAVLDLNLRAPFLCAQQAARRMPAGGVIINISDSGAGKVWTGYPAYAVSKSGLEMLTRLLARSLAPSIRVNAVAPGLILPGAETSPEDWERITARVPLHKPGSPEDVAWAVAFLVQNGYITGQTIVVDGGYQLV
ncbi:MAG TPA: SDR family oxidoreductase [Anaerolineaceae bacterium]